jgi:hypothetical protein
MIAMSKPFTVISLEIENAIAKKIEGHDYDKELFIEMASELAYAWYHPKEKSIVILRAILFNTMNDIMAEKKNIDWDAFAVCYQTARTYIYSEEKNIQEKRGEVNLDRIHNDIEEMFKSC